MARAGRRVRVTRRLASAAAVASLLVAGACGVPTDSGVIVDGPPVAQQLGQPGNQPEPPPGPTSSDPETFVNDYLDAIGSSSGDAAAQAARAFMTGDAQKRWAPSTEITVVRPGPVRQSNTAQDTYTVDVQVVGVFDPDTGTLDQPDPGLPTMETLTFEVTRAADTPSPQLHFESVPPGLFMTVTTGGADGRGLGYYYSVQTVYFWDANRLVAEPRYLPAWMSDGQKEAKIVNWILAGTSPAMEAAGSRPLVTSVTLLDPTIRTVADHLVVNLSSGAREVGTATLRQLVEQIGWSFGPGLLKNPIELQIDNKPQFVMDPVLGDAGPFQAANLSAERWPAADFAIADGVVHPLANPSTPLTGVLNTPLNSDVLSAAITSDQRFAAFVRPTPDGGQALWIVHNGVAAPASPALTGRSITGPAWVLGPPNSPPQLAVLVDGALVLVLDARDRISDQVLRPAGGSPVSWFAVSPEGSRISWTSDGRLFVATIVTQAGRSILSSPPREINLRPATADVVAWRSEITLVVGGRLESGDTGFYEVNVDGDNIGAEARLDFQSVTQISAYPAVALVGVAPAPPPVLVQAGGRAYQVYVSPSQGVPVELTWLNNVETPATPAPGSTGTPRKPSPPVNPFYSE